MAVKGENTVKLTPMLIQYLEIKEQYKDYILFFRLGDFYEMFFDDAVKIAAELELTLTSRASAEMCGVPFHACDTYIKRLVDKGYKVAICEQISAPDEGKGLVERSVTRIVTAGTLIEDSMLDETRNNFLACFFSKKDVCGIVFADLSTGELILTEKEGKDCEDEIITEISRYSPVELIFNKDFLDYKKVSQFIRNKVDNCTGDLLPDEIYDISNVSLIKEQFGCTAEELGISDKTCALCALCAALRYFKETGKNNIARFTKINVQTNDSYMALNFTTRRNLELTETMRGKERRGSLMWVLDKTRTSMGKRKLRQFIERPLTSHTEILKRLDGVDELVRNVTRLSETREALTSIYDIERLLTRVIYKTASPRDIWALGRTCAALPALKEILGGFNSQFLTKLNSHISPLESVAALIENAVKPEPPALVKDGNYINDKFNPELDKYRKLKDDSNAVLLEIEEKERGATGIRNLRVGYNRIFGYYIEVSKGNIGSVPAHYARKQTLANGERYITEELKNVESEILGAHDKILALEAEILNEVRDFITDKKEEIQETAEAVSVLDVFSGFAAAAIENNYARPEISLENVLQIKDSRHPVIEKILRDTVFTPNDVYLDGSDNRFIILTGPNMAGKSTYMRQIALITIMAQIGSFVPAKSARIGVTDRIFTRVGASDDLAAGQSTFMVEMNEVAEILSNATSKSLVILDEIGRGTSTFDGISIAKAVAEFINNNIKSKTLFATHYHELISLEKNNRGIRNFSVAVRKKGDEIQFLHKITEGGTDDSYGIEVARLAGLPQKVISGAKASLRIMERSSKIELEEELLKEEDNTPQIDFVSIAKEKAVQTLKNTDINSLTPIEALGILAELKKSLG